MLKFSILAAIFALVTLSSGDTFKVNPSLAQTLISKGSANIIIRMASGTEKIIQQITQTKFHDRGSRLTSLTQALKTNAADSQSSVLQVLRSFENLKVESLWISNEIYFPNANSDIVNRLAEIPEIAEIREEIVIHLENLKSGKNEPNIVSTPVALEPNLIRIEAYRVWEELGIRGENAIVSSIDTGVRGTHIALARNFVGEYGWFDPPYGTTVPEDFVGQGTHSMGVMVGKYAIGVAPQAKWMACRGCDFSCQESSLTACAQWVLCPTLADGTSPNCTKAPHVVNNAWWTLGGSNFFDPSIRAWKAGGIIPVFTAGNDGPACLTIRSPADSTVGVVAVASTTNADQISTRSSQGPSFFNQIKPDIVAPGESIVSASNLDDTAFVPMLGAGSGTAHVAGTTALIKSANMDLTYENVTQLLYGNTDKSTGTSGQDCGGVDDESEYPNNSIGWGRLNSYKAVGAARKSVRHAK